MTPIFFIDSPLVLNFKTSALSTSGGLPTGKPASLACFSAAETLRALRAFLFSTQLAPVGHAIIR